MVISPKQTTVAYRCPHCGTGVMSAVSLFHLRGNLVRLKCTICPKPHRYTVSEKIFFGEELFVLPCAYSDINIAMMGDTNHVKAELARTEMQLLDLMEENGISDFSALHKEADEVVSDPQVLEILTFVIRDLDEEGKIYCNCPPEEGTEGDFELEVLPQGVKITCKRCGATKLLPANSLLDAHEFLNADSLTLE